VRSMLSCQLAIISIYKSSFQIALQREAFKVVSSLMALLIMRLIIFAGAKQICRDTKVTGGRKLSSDSVNNYDYDGTETWKNMKNNFLFIPIFS
jgi:hypothetical protein